MKALRNSLLASLAAALLCVPSSAPAADFLTGAVSTFPDNWTVKDGATTVTGGDIATGGYASKSGSGAAQRLSFALDQKQSLSYAPQTASDAGGKADVVISNAVFTTAYEHPGIDEVGGIDSQAAICVYTNTASGGALSYYGWAGAYTVDGTETNLTWFALSGATPVEGATNTVTMSFDYTVSPATVTFKIGDTELTPKPVQLSNNTKTQVSAVSFSGQGSIAELAGATEPGAVVATFLDGDGTTITNVDVAVGATPVYPAGAPTPTKTATAQWTFAFDHWDPALAAISADQTYTPVFTSNLVSYTITWLNDDDSLIDTTTVAYGTVPTHADASKDATAEWTYTFAGWDTTPVAVTGPATYKATYTSAKNSYTITWLNDDGSTIDTTTVEYGVVPTHADASKAPTAQYTHTFTGWSPTPVSVTSAATYTATFSSTVNEYTIAFVDGSGNTLQSSDVAYGETPAYTGQTPTKEATAQYTYTFTGWDPEVASVTGDQTYTAQFSETVNEYTISWDTNGDGTVDDTTTLAYGSTPTHADGSKAADAQYTYTFDAWSPAITSVTGDKTYTATFTSTVNSYTITWLNDDDSVIDTTTVAYGTVPTHANATKPATAEWTYTFAGWDTTPVAVTGPATYKAVFTSAKNSYTITFENYDGTELQSSSFEYGQTPVYSGATPTKPATTQYTYTFSGWDPAISSVTGAQTYTAQFDETEIVVPTLALAKPTISSTVLASGAAGATVKVAVDPAAVVTATNANVAFSVDGNVTNATFTALPWNDPVDWMFQASGAEDLPGRFYAKGEMSWFNKATNELDTVTDLADGMKGVDMASAPSAAGQMVRIQTCLEIPEGAMEELPDSQGVGEARTGFAVAQIADNGDTAPAFYAYTGDDAQGVNGWVKLSGVNPAANTTNDLLIVLDVQASTARYYVDGIALYKDGTGARTYAVPMGASADNAVHGIGFANADGVKAPVVAEYDVPFEAAVGDVPYAAAADGLAAADKTGAQTLYLLTNDIAGTIDLAVGDIVKVDTAKGSFAEGAGVGLASSVPAGYAIETSASGDVTTYTVGLLEYPIVWKLELAGATNAVANALTNAYTVANLPITLFPAGCEGYTFDGWTNNVAAGVQTTIPAGTTGAVTNWATWHQNAFTITWNVEGATTTSEVLPGNPVAWPGADDPVKPENDTYSYNFLGWSDTQGGSVIAELPGATGDTTYFAVFEPVYRDYTITWNYKASDGTDTSDTTTVHWGETPSRANPAGYVANNTMYAFDAWSPAPAAFDGTVTAYTATYTSTAAKATVITIADNGATTNVVGYYASLADAVDAAPVGATVVLLDDVALSATQEIGKDLTIDLNGNDIAATDARAIWVKQGTVALTGEGTVSANGAGLAESSSVIRVGDGAVNGNTVKLTIGEDVVVSSAKSYGVTVFGKNAGNIELDVYGTVAVTSTGEADAAISGNGNSGLSPVAITIRDGATVTAVNQSGIYMPGAGTLTIEGGEITAPTAVYAKAGTINVSGGTLTGTGAETAYQYYGNGPKATGDALVLDNCGYPNGSTFAANITGGTFVSQNAKSVGSYAYGTDATSGEERAALADFIPATVDGQPNPARFSDADADGVPAGYALQLVPNSDPAMYAVAQIFTVIYANYDGAVLQVTTNFVGDATPAYANATPTKPSTDATAYVFENVWSPEVAATVTADATYVAQFTEKSLANAIWIGGASGDWNDAANWDIGYVPTSATVVTFTNDAQVALDHTDACKELVLTNANVTLVRADGVAQPILNIYGNEGRAVSVSSGATGTLGVDNVALFNQRTDSAFSTIGCGLEILGDVTFRGVNPGNNVSASFAITGKTTISKDALVKTIDYGTTKFQGGIEVAKGVVAKIATKPHGTAQIGTGVTLVANDGEGAATAIWLMQNEGTSRGVSLVGGASVAVDADHAETYYVKTRSDKEDYISCDIYEATPKATVFVVAETGATLEGAADGTRIAPGDVLSLGASGVAAGCKAVLTIAEHGGAVIVETDELPYSYTSTGVDIDVSVVAVQAKAAVITVADGGATTNTVLYLSFAQAFEAAPAGATVKLFDDVALSETLVVDQDLTLDLNGNDVTATDCRAIWVKQGTVALTGEGTVSANGAGLAESSSVIRVGDSAANENTAKLTIGEDVVVSSAKSYGVTVFGKNAGDIGLDVYGTVAVTSTGEADAAISGNGNSGLSPVAITIRDGATVTAVNQSGIYMPGAGTLTIEGGEITAPTAVYAKAGTVNVSGGTLTGTGTATAYQYYGNGPKATGDALVLDNCGYPNGATFAANITGGTFVSQNAKSVGSYAYGTDATSGEERAALADFIPPTVDGQPNPALFSDAEADGVPEGYKLALVEGSSPSMYQVVARTAYLDPVALTLYPNCSNYVYVVDAPAGSTYKFKFEGDIGSGGFSSTAGWGKPYGKTPGGTGTVTATVSNNNEQVAQLVCNVTVKDVVAVVDGVEYPTAEWADAVAAAIAGDKVLEVYWNVANVTLSEGQTLRWKPADNRKQGKVTALAPAATAEAMYKVTSTKDNATGITTAVCTNQGAPNVMITKADGSVSYAATLSMTTANATYKLLRSFSQNGMINASAAGMTLDLNGQTLTTDNSIYVRKLLGSASLTIKDTSDPGAGAVVCTVAGNPVIWANGEGNADTVTIESGSFTGAGVVVYTYDGGVANIAGGTFSTQASDKRYVLNEEDSNRGTIHVSGGSFEGFDPSNGNDGDLVVDGYVSVANDPSAGWYTVKPAYTVLWVADGTTLETDENVASNTVPTYDGDTPTKAPDAQYTYTFADAWTPAVGPVVSNTTFTAVFTETLNTYTVTWKNWNGDVLETDENVPYGTTPTYDGETPERTADAAGTYTFTGWNPGVGPIEGETVYIAQFSQAGAKATVISVADSSQTYFGDLASAIAAAQPGDTVRLLEDAELTATIVIAKDLVIDLNGNDIAATGTRALQVKSGNVKITGSGTVSADGAGLVANSSVIRVGDAAANAVAATLVVDTNVVVSSSTCYGVTVFGKNSDGDDATTDVSFDLYGTVSIDTPKVAHGCDAAIAGNGNNGLSPVDVTIHDGATVSSTYSTGVFFPGEGTLAVDGGSVSGTDGIEMRAGTLVVNDGTVTATGSYAAPAANGDGTTGNGGVAVLLSQHTTEKPISATIAGGELVGAKAFVEVDTVASATPSAGVAASITGGTIRGEVETANLETVIPADSEALFTDADADGVADGCCLVETEAGSGLYQIATAKASVISVADGSVEYYADFATAVAQAAAGDTVRLLDDAALASTVAIAKDLVIDLNGKNITATDTRALWVKAGDVELTGEGTVSATGTGLGETSSVIRVGDAGTAAAKLTVGKDVTVSTDRSYAISAFGKNAGGIELVVNGTVSSTASGKADAAIAGNGNSGNSPTTITINEGAVVSSTNGAGIFKPDAGTLTIAGGSVTGPTALYVKSGVVNVTGGTLTANGAKAAYQTTGDGALSTGDAIVVDNCGYPNGAPTVTVTGGTIVSQNGQSVASYAKVGLDPVAEIIPGTSAAKFSDADADGVAEGYYLVAVEGTSSPVLYEVAPRTSVIGTVVTVADNAVYDGTTQDANMALVVKPTADGTALVLDTDYIAVFATNALVNAGDYNVKVVGVGAWKDETNVTFTVAQRPATFTAASDTKVYDGTALAKDAFTATGLVEGHTATATVAGSQTDVGVSSNVVSAAAVKDANDNDVTANYTFTYVDGELKVTPAAMAITIAGVDSTSVYTGAEQTTNVAWTATSETVGFVATKVSYTGDVSVAGTDVADYAYNLDATKFVYADDNFTATFTVDPDGKFAITPAKIAVPTAVAGLVYDGTEKTGVEPGTGYTLEGNTATAAGDYTATATLAANYAWEDETLSGPQTVAWSIGKATVAVTAENKTQVYGEAAEALTYTTDPATLIEGNSFSGALAREEGDDVGPYAITQGTLSAGDNYEIDFTGATYTITAAPMTITVAGYNGVYDGAAHQASATTVPDGATVTWSTDGGETWSDTVPSVTGVANVAIVAKATLDNYADATATTSLVVTARAVALTAASDTKVYDGTALVKDAFTATNLVSGHTATATVTGSQTAVGASSNVVSAAVIKDAGDNDVTANYTFTYVDGELKVTAATVQIPAAPGNKVYNGQNQTADVTAPATVEVTNDGGKDAGDYTVTFALKDTANYTWSDGSVTNQTFGWSITQKALKLIAEDKEVAHGAAAPAYSYKVDETDGLVEGDSLATEPAFSCAYAAGDPIGTYAIGISGAVAPNYAITYANGTLTVTSNPFTVIWIVDGTQTSSELEWGTVPVFGGSTDKATDGKYAYAFTGWTDGETQYAVGTALPGVTGAVTYTATYAKTIDTPLALAVADEKLDSTAVSAAAKTATVAADLIGAVEGVTVTEASGATVTIDEDTATASFSNLEWNQGVEWTMTAQQTAADDAQTAESASLPGKFYVKPEAEWFAATAQDLDDIADGSDAAVAYTAPKASNEGEMVRVHTKIAVPAGGLPAAPATGTAKVGFAVLQLENDTAPAYYAFGNGAWTKLSGVEPAAGDHDYLAVYDLAAETPTVRYYIDGVALYAAVDGGSDVYALPLAAGTTSLKSISFASKEMVKDDIVAEQDVSYVAAVETTPYTDIDDALDAAGTAGEKTLALLKTGVALDPAVSLGSGEKLVVDYAKGTFTNETPVVSGVAGYDVKVTEAETVKTYELDPIVYPIEYVLNGGDNDPSNTNEYTVAILPLALADASRTGYRFDGWTNNFSANAVVTSIPVGTLGAVTNVATWSILTYTIGYDLAGGALPEGETNPTSYTVESADIALVNPAKTGYDFAGWTGTGLDAASTAVTIPTGSTGDREYTATWAPALVDYTVKHLQQSVDGQSYVEVEGDRETKQGYTESQTEAVAKTYEGFQAGVFQQTEIAADGSTVVEIRYDRASFVLSIAYVYTNGTEAATGYTDTLVYGATYSVDSPVVANYTAVPATVAGTMGAAAVATNVVYTATPFAIAYDLDGGATDPADANPTSYSVETETFTLVNPTKDGFTFAGWTGTGLGDATNLVVTVAKGSSGDRSYVAMWAENKVTVIHVVDNGDGTATTNVAGYVTIADALAAAQAGDTVQLLDDVSEDATIEKNVTIDLNGKTWEGDVSVSGEVKIVDGSDDADGKLDGAVAVANGGSVEVAGGIVDDGITGSGDIVVSGGTVNGGIEGDGEIKVSGGAVNGCIDAGGTLTITGGTITAQVGADEPAIVASGTATISGGSVSGDVNVQGGGTATISGDAAVEGNVTVSGTDPDDPNSPSSVVVDGGTVNGNVFASNGGTATVSDGEVTGTLAASGDDSLVSVTGDGTVGSVYAVEGGQAVVTGGTVGDGIVAGGANAVTVTGGTVNGTILGDSGDSVSITGGHFEKDPSDYVAPGYYADGDDTNGYDVKERKSLEGAVITVADATYSGSAQAPAPVVKVDDETLELGKDFVAVYATNDLVNADTYAVSIVAIGAWIGSADTTFTIGKAPLSITAENTTVKRGSASLPTFEYGYAGFVNGESAANLATQLSDPVVTNALGEAYSTAARTGDTFVIVPTGATSANYAITFVDGTLTVVAGAIASVDGTEYEAIADAVAAAGKTADGKVITMLDDADAAVALVPGDVLKIELDGFDVDVAVADAYAARWSLVSDTVEGVTTYTLDEIKAKGLMITEFDFEDASLVYNTGKAEDLAWDSDKAYCTVVTATDLKAARWNVVGGTSTLHSELGANQDVKVENLDTSAPVRFFRIAVTPYVLSVDDTVEFAPPAEGGDEP